MNVAFRKALFSFPGVILCSLLVCSCTVPSSEGPTAITKVNPYHLFPGSYQRTDDPMVDFEYRRRIRGAVTSQDRHDRYGHYITVFWKTDQRDVPITIRLNYRQGATGPKIITKEIDVPSPKRKNETEFRIVGDEYATNGPVTQWKASIVQNGEVITEYRSFLWK